MSDKKKISWITMFLANSGGLSSKRIAGISGWMLCLVIFTLGFWLGKEIPEFGDYVLITSASLLGVDTLSGIFTKGDRK